MLGIRNVVVDTNVIRKDWRLAGATWQTLLRAAQEFDLKILIPKVVSDEILLLLERHYRACEAEATKALRKIELALGASLEPPALPSLEEAISSYRQHILELARAHNIRELPYPEISHEEVVTRAGRRIPPFRDSDRGYKDFLIWRTVVGFLSKSTGNLAFVTHNHRDFFVDGHLKREFRSDLEQSEIDCGRVSCYESLSEFVTKAVEPHLKPLEEFRTQLNQGQISWLDVNQLVRDSAQYLEFDELPGSDFDIPAETVIVTHVGEPEDVEVYSVLALSKHEMLLNVSFSVLVEVEGEVVIDDPGYRLAPSYTITGSGHTSGELEVIADTQKQEVEVA